MYLRCDGALLGGISCDLLYLLGCSRTHLAKRAAEFALAAGATAAAEGGDA